MQNLALEDMMGVAGKPTTTTPTPRLSISRLKALHQETITSQSKCLKLCHVTLFAYGSLAGLKISKGMTGESSLPYTINPISMHCATFSVRTCTSTLPTSGAMLRTPFGESISYCREVA